MLVLDVWNLIASGGKLGSTDEFDAVRDGREHRIEAFGDRFRRTRKINNQGAAAGPRHLPGENRRRHSFDGDGPHALTESRQHSVADRGRSVWGHIPGGGSRPSRRDHQTATGLVAELDQGSLDFRSLIWNDALHLFGYDGEHTAQVVGDRRSAQVLVLAAAGAVGDRKDTDLGSQSDPNPFS